MTSFFSGGRAAFRDHTLSPAHASRAPDAAAGKLDTTTPLECGDGLFAGSQVFQRLSSPAGSVLASPAEPSLT